jgi:4-amino-4-deoxy-L-arabinose transferase-like glycosyltransferase
VGTDVGLGICDEAHENREIDRELEQRDARAQGVVAPDARRPPAVVVAVLMLLLVGAGLRAVRLDEPPLDYHSTRQYNSALLARKYEQALGGGGAGVGHAVVSAAAPAEIEPPIMEAITAVGWRLSGSEPLWFPRALSILAWSLGGWLLYLLLERLASRVAGIVGVAVWSLLPFGIAATRTFQPDPLMVAAIVGALLAAVMYDDEPSRRRLVVAGLAGGFAVLVKVPAIFFIAPVFVALAYHRGGFRALWSRRTALYVALLIGPALVYHVYGFLIGGFLQGQEGGRLLPHFLVTATFWREWARKVGETVGFVLPITAMAGVLVARGRARRVGVALAGGYVSFGLVFSYHYATHSYYHLPLLLVLSVGVGLLAHAVTAFVRTRQADLPSVGVAAATATIVLAATPMGAYSMVPAAIPAAIAHTEVAVPAEIGTLVHHSTELVFLAPSYGDTLKFYGGVAGTYWPGPGDAKLAQLEGTAPKSVPDRLADIRRDTGARFFVVTDMGQWQAQPDLRAYLNTHYSLVASNRDYLVYDLRGTAS